MTTGEQIKEARIAKRMTQEELAYEVGISLGQIGRWEKNEQVPSLKSLRAIEKILDVKIKIGG